MSVAVNDQLFVENQVIQKLFNMPVWTVNNNDPRRFVKGNRDPLKVPLDPIQLLRDGRYAGFSEKRYHSHCVPYNALAKLTNFEKALRIDVNQTHILAIDIEAVTLLTDQFPQERQMILDNCCANYIEESKHGGQHRLLEIPDILIDDYPDLFKLTQFHTAFLELFPTGNHYMTLTHKVIPTPYVDPNSSAYIDKVDRFLQYASRLMEKYGMHKHLDLHRLNQAHVETPFVHELADRIEKLYPFEYIKYHSEIKAEDKHRLLTEMRNDPKKNPLYQVPYEKFSRWLPQSQVKLAKPLEMGQSRFDYSICAHFVYVVNQWYCQTIPLLNPNGNHGLSQWHTLKYDEFVALVRLLVVKFMNIYGLTRDKFDSQRGSVDYLTYLIDGICQRDSRPYPNPCHIMSKNKEY